MKAGMLRGTCVAVAGFVLAGLLVAVPSQAGSAPLASAAKKKCPPKVAYSAGGKKKKKCKKRRKIPIVLPNPDPVLPVPVATTLERARITWSANRDVDLFIWDQAGNVTSFFDDGIPAGSHSGDAQTAGFEAFTDEQWLVPVPQRGNRVLTYGLCLHGVGSTPATLNGLLPNGAPFTLNINLPQGRQLVTSANGFMPAPASWCA